MSDDRTKQLEDKAKPKRSKHRSPNYPYVGLRKALDRATQVREAYRQSEVPLGVVHQKWGYKPFSGVGNQVVAALKAFGLIDLAGQGKKKTVRITDLANQIIGGHPDRDKLLREAAFGPAIYADIWNKFKDHGLPPDEAIATYLEWDRHFNPDAIPGIIADFRDTIDLANAEDETDNGREVGSAGYESSGGESYPVEDKPPTRQQTNGALLPGGPSMRTDTFTLEEGATIALQYPSSLSASSYQDLRDWMEIELRKIKRLIHNREERATDME